MKCNLVFNEEELTWDCPCHGSRFDIDGNIITSPTKNNIKKK
jgi:Rieske Fe-S protein